MKRQPVSNVRKAKLYGKMLERMRSAAIIIDNKMVGEVLEDYIGLARSADGEYSAVELNTRYKKVFKSLEGKYKV